VFVRLRANLAIFALLAMASLVVRPGFKRPAISPVPKAKVQDLYGKLPLRFEANQGQTDSSVKFLARGQGYTLFLTSTEAVYSFARRDKVFRLKLVGANPSATVEGVDALSGTSNYFIGNDPSKWRTNVSAYAKTKFRGVYPGIDLVYYGNGKQMEYDFVVAPGADPNAIRLEIGGSDETSLDANGDLVLKADGAEVRFARPVVYQEVAGKRQRVDGGYARLDNERFGFKVATFDSSRPLVIDPTLVYGTYLGGSGADQALALAVDSSGNAYLTGSTTSPDFPTVGSIQSTLGSKSDASFSTVFVSRINPAGTSLLYSTYLGGSGSDSGLHIGVDSSGNSYVVGSTSSANFPTTPGALATTGGFFVAKLTASGTTLAYSTRFPGNQVTAAVVDPAGNVYIAGSGSTGFPTTTGAYKTDLSCPFPIDIVQFIAKLSTTGGSLVFSTFLEGPSCDTSESILGLAVDSAGNVFATGLTTAADFPTANAFQSNYGGGSSDAFVTKLNSTGSALLYSSFLGGNGDDSGSAISVDASGSAYIAGIAGANFPATQPSLGTSNGFVAKVSAAGGLVYATSGVSAFRGVGLVLDNSGNQYIGGSPLQKVNSNGTAILYKITLPFASSPAALALDGMGNVYAAGSVSNSVSSGSFVAPSNGAYQTVFRGGGNDAYLTKISPTDPVPTLASISPSSVVVGSAINLTVNGTGFTPDSMARLNGVFVQTLYGSGIQVALSAPLSYSATAGVFPITVVNPDGGGGTSNALNFTVNNPAPSITALSTTSVATGSPDFTLTVTGSGFLSGVVVQWNGSGRTTTFVSSTSLTAAIKASDLAAFGSYPVTALNPLPTVGASSALNVSVVDPAITTVSPTSALLGSNGFTLTVTGTNFLPTAVVQWNAQNRATTFVSPTALTAQILASDLTTDGLKGVQVINVLPSTGTSGNRPLFTVYDPTPTISGLSPGSVTAGASGILLNVLGTNFVSGATVRWNGTALTTTFLNSTNLAAFVSPNFLATGGTESVTVNNPVGTAGSNASTFTVNNPTPVITGSSPISSTAGAPGFLLNLTGTGFVPTSQASVSNSSRATVYESSTMLGIFLTAQDLLSPGTLAIIVTNPTPSGGTSNTFSFPVTSSNPAPTLGNLSPSTVAAGSGGFTLTVFGSNFAPASTVLWNGSSRPTTFASSQQLSASISAADVASAATIPVTVFSPTPGGGTSSAISFTVGSSSQGSVAAQSLNGGATLTVSVPIVLTLNNGATIGALSLGLRVVPGAGAPPIGANLSFQNDAALPATAPSTSNTTTSDLALFWSTFTTPLSGTVTLGVLQIPIPAAAAVGQTYDVQVTGAGAAQNNAAIPVTIGADGTLSIVETYLEGDVFPATSDTVGNFGDGVINTLDLLEVLRMVAGVLPNPPKPCSDRFDAMDVWPLDTPTTPGGDKMINTLDLLATLRRSVNLDTSRPVRIPRGLACSSAAPEGRRPPEEPAEGVIEVEGNAVYLRAQRDLNLAGLALSLRLPDSSPARYTPGSARVAILDLDQPGLIAMAWLDGITLTSGSRLLLGYVDGADGGKVIGVAANEAGGRDVRIIPSNALRK